jgi:Protein of unknown function (DUF3106)
MPRLTSIKPWKHQRAWMAGCLALVLSISQAQPQSPYQPAPSARAEAGPTWAALSPNQREALKPLEREWPRIDADRKHKWLAIAAKFPSLSAQERTRIQARMADWTRLSPQQRGVARQQYQAAKRAAPQDRQSQWAAYEALPVQEKQTLAARAASPAAASRTDRRATSASSPKGSPSTQGKANIVPNPLYSVHATPVNAMAVQAQPGATTTTINKRAAPPLHQQPGLPKIAASQGFVDKSTLLPKRGPQGAAARSSSTPQAVSPE